MRGLLCGVVLSCIFGFFGVCYNEKKGHEQPSQTRSVANFAQTVIQSAHNADF